MDIAVSIFAIGILILLILLFRRTQATIEYCGFNVAHTRVLIHADPVFQHLVDCDQTIPVNRGAANTVAGL